jgi:hypothetical protein
MKGMAARVHEILEEGNLIGRHDVLLLLIQAPASTSGIPTGSAAIAKFR